MLYLLQLVVVTKRCKFKFEEGINKLIRDLRF